jgi:hypothetical protein
VISNPMIIPFESNDLQREKKGKNPEGSDTYYRKH